MAVDKQAENGKDLLDVYVSEYKEKSHTMQFDFVQDYADLLNTGDFSDIINSSAEFAHSLCGLFALMYVCNLVWKSWSNGSQLDLQKIIKPLVIGFCIMNFNQVVGFVDLIVSGMGKATQEFSDKCSEKSALQFKEKAEQCFREESFIYDNENKAIDDLSKETDGGEILTSTANSEVVAQSTKSYEDKMLEKVGLYESLPRAIITELSEWVIGNVQMLFGFLASIAMVCILFLGFVGKCIFYFFGPVLFAMELIPGMEGRISSFFKKYITYSIYPCCINVVNGVLIQAMIVMSDSYNYVFVHVVIGLVGACMFCAIPSLASQLMDTASNQLGAYAAMGLQYMTGKVGTAVKGGTSSAAGKASSEKGMLGKMASVGAKKAASISNMMKGGKE